MIRTSIHALVVVSISLPAFGYEIYQQDGYGEVRLGDPIQQVGTRRTESSPAVEYRVNLLQVDDTNLDGRADASSVLPESDRSRLSILVDSACRYWEQVPSSSIRLRLAGNDQTSTYVNLRPYVLVTLGRIPSGTSGASWGTASNGQFFPLGIIINLDYFRRVSDAVILSTIVHEIGHSISIAHSSCDRYLTWNARFKYTDSEGAFMSYGDRDGRAVLHTDDVAAALHAYPVLAAQSETGSIEGDLVDASGGTIFGGNVFAVNEQNRAVVSRISGLADFRSLSSRHGRFRLTGLAPGTYTVVAASVDDAVYRIGSRPRLPFDAYYQRGFAAAVRTGVVVRGAESVNLGRVAAGSEQSVPPPGTAITWPAVNSAEYYLVYLYSYRDAKWIVLAQRTSTNSIQITLAEGRYYLFVYARVGGTWVVADQRIVRSGDKPPVISAPASVTGKAGQPLLIRFSASDPLGGCVRIQSSGIPSGMYVYSGLLYWYAPVAGQYRLRLEATNEVGQKTAHEIALTIEQPAGGQVRIQWSRLPNDQYYYIAVYSYARATWVASQYLSDNFLSVRLEAGQHFAYGYRRVRLSSGSTCWQYVGYKVFSIDGDATVQLP
ncbi:MAG: carboxypeptidase regulatory-like domain-containing protein [Planctomycetes bacterium]|nr:carboxypeptidase regulatory-like domain-containing protein [Planctomycetota bacterium]